MVDLKRSIGGVKLYADTDNPENVAKLQKILDAAVKALQDQNAFKQQSRAHRGADFLEGLFGRKPFQ